VAILLACAVYYCWENGYIKCMWAGIWILAVWVVAPSPPLVKTDEAPIRFTTEAQAKRFLHVLLSLWAQGQLSDEALEELLIKHKLQDPCLCGECR
jgi:hypothetical protein